VKADVLVVIPAFNEEASLEAVVRGVRAAVPRADIAVINDGSLDRTGSIIDSFDVIALHLPHRMGVGAAEQTGFRLASRVGYRAVVRNDGDGQHNPAEIPLLLEALDAGGVDVVIGSRYLEPRGYVTPRLRRLGIRFLAGLLSLACRRRFTDPTSGFRAFNHRAIELCSRSYPEDYPEPESLLLLTRAGLNVKEIPVSMNPRYGGRSSIRTLDSILYMARVVLGILIGLLRAPPAPPEPPTSARRR
jgi:glycosyltransferase involved in cell wall biosynthesis